MEKYVGLSKKFQNMHDKCYNCHRYKIANEKYAVKKNENRGAIATIMYGVIKMESLR